MKPRGSLQGPQQFQSTLVQTVHSSLAEPESQKNNPTNGIVRLKSQLSTEKSHQLIKFTRYDQK